MNLPIYFQKYSYVIFFNTRPSYSLSLPSIRIVGLKLFCSFESEICNTFDIFTANCFNIVII